jgi:iron-sulfur cluster repair protein YtfE (RIC family)
MPDEETTTMYVTEPLRAEHRGSRGGSQPSSGWSREQTVHFPSEIVAFLRRHLVPHAAAEEVVLYPAVEEAMVAPGATAMMRADHPEILARIDRLAGRLDNVGQSWPDRALTADLADQLIGLSAMLELHLRKEEQVVLPMFDAALSVDQAAAIFEHMAEVAHR